MTQQFLLPCSCGQKVRVGNAQAGGQVICGCGKSISVPTLRGLRQLEPAPAEVAAVTKLSWSPVHGAVFATALLLAAAGIGTVAYHLFPYSQLVGWVGDDKFDYTVDRSPEMLKGFAAAIDAEIDALSPEEALAKMRETEVEGLGEKATLPWVVYKQRAESHLWWIKVGSALLGGGALIALATLFIGRR